MTLIRITHVPSGTLLAEGPSGWGITPFEGNFYVRRKYLCTDRLKVNYIPGLCIYKFLYVWMDLLLDDGTRARNAAWLYWLPNPLFPFIAFRVGFPGYDPEIRVERIKTDAVSDEPWKAS